MERKIVFLDIDGVLQPGHSQNRFDHIHHDEEKSDMPDLYRSLENKFQIDYSKYNQYDVAAVFFDWDKESVNLLKLTLSLTGAKIVLSSDWRRGGFERMKDFFTIYGLEKYYLDDTKFRKDIAQDFIDQAKAKHKEEKGEKAYLDERSIEILEWLSRNPDVKKWVAIDDMSLSGLDRHFVLTGYGHRFGWEDAEKSIRILSRKK